MLAIFHKAFAHPPEELNSPASYKGSKKPKLPEETLREFLSHHPHNTCSMSFGQASVLAYVRPDNPFSVHQRLFCGVDDIYCLFLGSLNNLSVLNKQYGLSKGTDEAMFVIEAYKTLRDRGPYPADQVVKELDGSFAFVVYDSKIGTVFAALGSDGGVKLYWGIAADGSVVISDDLDVVKEGCAKSFAPFPTEKQNIHRTFNPTRTSQAASFLPNLPQVAISFQAFSQDTIVCSFLGIQHLGSGLFSRMDAK
ncbi:stem-specific protein TSJT1-like isoform X2 [Vicia villosa]|uniref:stem-specific protein TSJT1-like isoform X2 n=1 Tax=Vicia villosa TaxID=3911 RepID=UPI00273C0174|nr:stem-specific protein TSJT1-like isoform X2 [Vicia villosa]